MIRKLLFLSAVLCLAFATTASAVPDLQLYIEGATYDTATQTWVLIGSSSFRLWAIGNVSGDGGSGTISNVQLTAAVLTSETGGGSISLSPTLIGGTGSYGGFTDAAVPAAPTGGGLSADGAVPVMGDGGNLPTHGIFGAGVSFYQWGLGNFSATTDPTGDFITSFPSPGTGLGQINAYDVSVTGYSKVHFDLFNTILAGNGADMAIFAPFSHDAEGGGSGGSGGSGGTAPEPGMLALMGSGLLGLVAARNRKK